MSNVRSAHRDRERQYNRDSVVRAVARNPQGLTCRQLEELTGLGHNSVNSILRTDKRVYKENLSKCRVIWKPKAEDTNENEGSVSVGSVSEVRET